MNFEPERQAGSGMLWRAAQLAVIKGIFLARTLILARLLMPDDFGLFAAALVGVDFLASISNLGLTSALVQLRDPDEQHYNVAWTIGLGRGLLITGSLFFAAPLLAQFLGEPRAIWLMRAVALHPTLEAAASIKVVRATRELRFRSIALIGLPEAIVNTVVAIALAQLYGAWALAAGTLAGTACTVLMSYLVAPHRPRIQFCRAAVQPLLDFGRWIFVTGLIALAGRVMLPVMVVQRLGAAELGLYYLAAKLAFIPAEVSSEVVGTVAFPLFARLQADLNQLARSFRAILISISMVLFPVCALVIALTPGLVGQVLGPRWNGTTTLIQLLVLVNAFGLFGDLVGPILKGIGQPHRLAIIELVQSSLLILTIWISTDYVGVRATALAWLVAVGASQIISAAFLQHVLPRTLAGLVGPLSAITAASASGGLLAVVVALALPGWLGLAAGAWLGFAAIAMLLWLADRYLPLGLGYAFCRAFPPVAGLFQGRSVEIRPAEVL